MQKVLSIFAPVLTIVGYAFLAPKGIRICHATLVIFVLKLFTVVLSQYFFRHCHAKKKAVNLIDLPG